MAFARRRLDEVLPSAFRSLKWSLSPRRRTLKVFWNANLLRSFVRSFVLQTGFLTSFILRKNDASPLSFFCFFRPFHAMMPKRRTNQPTKERMVVVEREQERLKCREFVFSGWFRRSILTIRPTGRPAASILAPRLESECFFGSFGPSPSRPDRCVFAAAAAFGSSN